MILEGSKFKGIVQQGPKLLTKAVWNQQKKSCEMTHSRYGSKETVDLLIALACHIFQYNPKGQHVHISNPQDNDTYNEFPLSLKNMCST